MGELEISDERKFTAGMECGDAALAWLRHLCLPDPAFPAGVIRSLYYDTLPLHSYEEKRAGDFIKTKVRLRWYDTAQGSADGMCPAFLEVKRRLGRGRRKWRKKLSFGREWLSTAPLDDERFCDVLAEAQEALAGAFPSDLQPAAEISYTRHRFVCPETMARVCVDMNILSGRVNNRFLPFRGQASLPEIVLEIKDTSRDVPRWVERLYRLGFRQRSFSKYGECIARLMEDR